MPATIHAASSQPGAPTLRAMSADTMKIPDPIIEPTTTIVESYRPRPRLNSVSRAVAGVTVDCDWVVGFNSALLDALRCRGARPYLMFRSISSTRWRSAASYWFVGHLVRRLLPALARDHVPAPVIGGLPDIITVCLNLWT